ncbi:TetR/AcrR family transcriptional regulator [Amnibacterium kyonggiense]
MRDGVLDAAVALLEAEGLGAVTFDRVASVAGSSKTTLYKWWPSTGALAAEAYFARVAGTLRFADTGDVEADLKEQLRAYIRLLTSEGAGA